MRGERKNRYSRPDIIRTVKTLGTVLFLSLVLSRANLTSLNAQAQESDQCPDGSTVMDAQGEINSRGVRQRTGPGTNYSIEGYHQLGDHVNIICSFMNSMGETWYGVRVNGNVLFVLSDYASTDDLGIITPPDISQPIENTQTNSESSLNTGQCPPGQNGMVAIVIDNAGQSEIQVGDRVSIIESRIDDKLVQTSQCHSIWVPASSLSGGGSPPTAQYPQTMEGWWGGIDNPVYDTSIFQGCRYSTLTITEMQFTDYQKNQTFVPVDSPQDVISWIGRNVYGQNTWLGYQEDEDPPGMHRGFAIDPDARVVAELHFIAEQNEVNGQIVQDDRVLIQFMKSPSMGRLYALPYVSIGTSYARSNGKNMGQHLCNGHNQIEPKTIGLLETSGILTLNQS